MNATLERQIREQFGSNSKLAKELHDAWKRANPKEAKKRGVPSLATEIGRLLTGKTTWWKNHLDAAEVLAGLLEIEVEDLFPPIARPVIEQHLPFPEFPMLKPLGLHEEPFSISGRGWLLSFIAIEPNQHRWVTAPAGAGKSLVIRWLASRSDLRNGMVTLSVRTLGAAIEIADPGRPLVVEIEQADPDRDREALRLLGLRTQATTVLAAFPLPIPKRASLFASTAASLRRPHKGDEQLAAWQEAGWQKTDDWRRRFLFWIQDRLAESTRDHLFDAAEVVAWLDEHDPEEALVRTAGEVLALCSVAFVHGLPKNRTLTTVAEQFRERLAAGTSSTTEESRHFWHHFGARFWTAVHATRWEDSGDDLAGLPDQTWEQLIPEDLTPPRRAADFQKSLMDIAAGHRAGARKQKVEELWSELLRLSKAQVVAMLKQDGVLRGTEDGRLSPFPRFAVHGTMLLHATRRIRERDTDWGKWAADSSRSRVVDEVLSAVPANELRDLVRRCVRSFDKGSLSSVAMTEALFAACARRLLGDPELAKGRVGDFQKLGMAQADLLFDPWGDPLNPNHTPRTRHQENWAHQAKWHRDGWTFTLRIPRPEGFEHPELEWWFPGWMKSLSLARLPRNMPSTYWEGPSHVASPEVQTLAWLAYEVVQQCTDLELPDEFNMRLLLPAAILATPEKKWPIRGRHVRALGHAWEATFLAWALGQASPEERDPVLRILWPACLQIRSDPTMPRPGEKADFIVRLAWLLWDVPGLFRVVTEHVPLDLVEQAIHDWGLSSSARTEAARHLFPALPERLRVPIVRLWANPPDGKRPNFAEIRAMLALIQLDDIQFLLELAGSADRGATGEYAQLIWKYDPTRALHEAREAVRAGTENAQSWCFFSDSAANEAVLGELEVLETPPAWAHRWALNRLSKGGPLAPRLYALMSRIIDKA